MNNNGGAKQIIRAAKREGRGKTVKERWAIYNKYKNRIYDLVESGQETPYIRQLLDALRI